MPILQLELNLWQQLEQAQAAPQAVDWHQLCLAFDTTIDQTPVGLRLATAADAIVEMAEVLAARADEFFSAWRRVPEDGPVLDEDLFAEFVRQSFHLDLDGLVGVPELYVRSPSEEDHGEGDSVVEVVTKEVALLLARAEEEEEPMPVMVLEHDEDVGAWAAIVREWMVSVGVDSVSISEVVDSTGLPVTKAWMAGMLEGFKFTRESEREEHFYSYSGLILQTVILQIPAQLTSLTVLRTIPEVL